MNFAQVLNMRLESVRNMQNSRKPAAIEIQSNRFKSLLDVLKNDPKNENLKITFCDLPVIVDTDMNDNEIVFRDTDFQLIKRLRITRDPDETTQAPPPEPPAPKNNTPSTISKIFGFLLPIGLEFLGRSYTGKGML